jgi:lysophospholipase L1-like esterase
MKFSACFIAALLYSAFGAPAAEEKPLPQAWDYAAAMKAVAAKFHGREGVVLHVGDSITYANPYSGWARGGEGKSDADKAALQWMHAGADNDTDGWYLARFDHPAGGRSYTAVGGIRISETLAGGKQGVPPLKDLLNTYKPRFVVMMLGTNDASAGRPVADYRRDVEAALGLMLDRGIVPILSTLPPHIHAAALARSYNEALREVARARQIPLIDFEREILTRRPTDWDGTLLNRGDVHPTADQGGAHANSAPTAENLRNSGYLLRGWLSVKKIEEVKALVLDGQPVALPLAPNPQPPTPNPSLPELRLPITRDTWFSTVGDEAQGSNGGSPQLKLKSIQEMSLLDIDTAPLKGQVVTSATLHLHLSSKEVLHRVTVSTFASEWTEGTAMGYAIVNGNSTFNRRTHPDGAWAGPGSDLTAVMLGQGGTTWRMAEATPPDAQGWQTVAVDPAVVGARIAGISYGFLIFDDTGTEWTRQGEKFTSRLFPNRYVNSRESGEKTAPYITVTLGPGNWPPPAVPTELRAEAGDFPSGEASVSWVTPTLLGGSPAHGPSVIGFLVDLNGKPAPRYLIPAAGKTGGRVTMRLRDLGFKAGETVNVSVRAIDGTGNAGAAAQLAVKTSDLREEPLGGTPLEPFKTGGPLPKLVVAEVAVVDTLDKMNPVTGVMIPAQDPAYLAANHLWDASKKRVRLHAGKNEFVSFQILFRGPVSAVKANLAFDGLGEPPTASFFRFRHVASSVGPMPDPLVPLGDGLSIPAADEKIDGQKSGAMLCEIYVPHGAAAGTRTGALTLTAGDQKLSLDVELTVWDFTLPDFLSFIPEMNCYGLPDNERDYYRLAHVNRTVLNRVPYYQSGSVADGCGPAWDGKKFDFTAWDKRFGAYFDGSAFADLPRKSVPVMCWYLPLQENWPTPIEPNYNGDYWADRAFKPGYRADFVSASRQFAEHFNQKNWGGTIFQCFFNGKVDFKTRGWSRASAPWLLDEPANFQDYWALRWFGLAFHEGTGAAPGPAKMMFRADVSRPEWQRDAFDPVLDYNVVGGGAFNRYRRVVLDRKQKFGQVVVPYGGTNDLHQSNMQPVGWSLDAWTLGADGVLPWQTLGNDDSWKKADALSLFYPGGAAGQKEPVPSIRLKAYLRGEQDVEYLVLLAQTQKVSQLAMGRRVRGAITLDGVRKGTGFAGEDAGMIDFEKLKPQDAWALRTRIGGLLDAARPAPKRQLVDFAAPKRDLSEATERYVSTAAPPPTIVTVSSGPDVAFPTGGPAQVIQGRAGVRDTVIDPAQPEKNFGTVERDNRLSRTDATSALLVRFDLAKLKVPAGAKVRKATVWFYVWDPSSRGKTKVCAFPLLTAWDETAATWSHPAAGQTWKGGAKFEFGKDTGPAGPHVVVEPDAEGSDTAEPPIEYSIDITDTVRGWLGSGAANNGVAIAPVIDRAIDDGQFTRFQVTSSRYRDAKFSPKLTVEFDR